MRELTISVGASRFCREWRPVAISWARLVDRLADSKATAETMAEYRAMNKGRKAEVKDTGGFVGGSVSGRRLAGAVASRSLVTLDIDYAAPDTLDDIREMFDGNAWCLYSTHSHTPERPRYRLVAPLDRDVTPDEYVAIARRVADAIGMDRFDDSTYEPHRLMYWPSHSADAEVVFESAEGAPFRADGLLGTYTDWRNPAEWPTSSRVGEALHTSGRKLEDPCLKGGMVGAFCRCYTITQAIEEFLPEVYEPTVSPDRWTYKAGSTAGGLVIYEDKWAFSHHGTDPIGGREVNAFDLVRIHRFGEIDEGAGEETRVTSLPSFKAMEELCESLPAVKVDAINHGLRRSAEDDFGEDIPEGGGNGGDEEWKAEMHTDAKHRPVADPYNFKLICDNDPALKDTVRYDCFADRAQVTRNLPWREVRPGDIWDDTDDKGLVWYISDRYLLTGKQAIIDAHDLVIRQSAFHPVRDYLGALSWDGTPRLDTMLVDYLSADDTPLVRAMTRKHMVAAVARIMRPGTKYDYALTLSGPEGIGKTTLIKKLGMKWYSNSFSSSDVGDKTSMEQVQGQWLIELGELVAVRKSTNEAFKNFITTDVDKFRPAYARKAVELPRQCVFWATTNERYFLKGDTGNRRFWTVYVHAPGEDLPTGEEKDVFEMGQDEVDQLWAEAVVRWKEGEPLYLDRSLDELSRAQSEAANEISGDERIGEIEAFIRRLLPDNWNEKTRQERADWFRVSHDAEYVGGHRRKYICSREIANECFGKEMHRGEMREINQMLHRIKGLEPTGPMNTSDKVYGIQRRYRITDEFWDVADRATIDE